MKVIILSAKECIFKGEASKIEVPGAKGRFEVLENHAPIISLLQQGVIKYSSDKNYEISIKSGYIEVYDNEVSICIYK